MSGRRNLTVNAIGGLCNRMRAIAAGVNLARLSERELKVVWRSNADVRAGFTDLFEPLPEEIQVIEPGAGGYMLKWDIPRKRNLYVPAIYQKSVYSKIFREGGNLCGFYDCDEDFAKEIAEAKGNILLISGTATGGCREEDIRRLFRTSAAVRELIEEKTAGFNEKTVGVHIRRTDNAKSIEASPVELFISEMERRIEADSEVNFFVASDDGNVMRTLAARFGKRVMQGDENASRTSLRGMLHGAADLWALAMTSEILGSYYSSYTDTAALIGNIPLKIISTHIKED